MRSTSRATADSALDVIPEVVCSSFDDPMELQVQADFRLWVRFGDGTQGLVDMEALVHSPRAGIFAPLADPATFATAHIRDGAVSWPNGADLAPDAMYEAIKAYGQWLLC